MPPAAARTHHPEGIPPHVQYGGEFRDRGITVPTCPRHEQSREVSFARANAPLAVRISAAG